ncbi:hypothetical protein GGR54DRAFT_592678 [Hypoxylon sp. NC1633]|nr:hypothetical protein GGR54DRAFT_592678 [Hypoxylon sp. NC1633]
MVSQQLWFFLREDMSISQFTQVPLTLSEVRKIDLTFGYCLSATKSPGSVHDYTFHIHSASMAAAVQLLSDESIIATYNIYCQRDPVVTIIIRKAGDPSPNTSRSASHDNSLAERRKVSASRGLLVPELFIQPTVRHVSGSMDINTLEPIDDKTALVTMHCDDETFTFTKDYLLGWIDSQLADFRDITKIKVQQIGPEGETRVIQLTEEIWQRCLIRGQWREVFGHIWDNFVRRRCEREAALDQIMEAVPGFGQACLDFVHDLKTYGTNKDSRNRLEGTGHEFYIGQPYFDKATQDQLLRLPATNGDTLESLLRSWALKCQDSTVCASHDFAPIFEFMLGVKWDIPATKATAEVRRSTGGLRLPGTQGKVKGLAKKGSKFLKNTIGRRGGKK